MHTLILFTGWTGPQLYFMTGRCSCQSSIMNLLYKNFQEKQLNSSSLTSCRHPGSEHTLE